MRTAWSYIRFSDPRQAQGDSQRRQVDGHRDYCERHNIRLAESLADFGISAFRGLHATKGALSRFLAAIESGVVKPGDLLLIENTDRLSREEVLPALDLFRRILAAKVEIVEIMSMGGGERSYTEESINRNPFDLMQVIMSMSRGHDESARKSQRVGEAWALKRLNAAKKPLGATCPGWLEFDRTTGKYHPREPQWSVMRRIVRELSTGVGAGTICRRLAVEGEPRLRPRAERWEPAVIYGIVRKRTLVGEYQPRRYKNGKMEIDGDPVKGYYPALITEKEWLRLQAAIRARRRYNGYTGGRGAEQVPNLFGPILVSGSSDARMRRTKCSKRGPCIVSVDALYGKEKFASFPYPEFERQFLSWVREVRLELEKPAIDVIVVLESRLADINSRLAILGANLDRYGPSDLLLRKVRQLEADQIQVTDQLRAAKAENASPTPSSKNLVDQPATIEDRERVRALIKRLIKRIRVWIQGNKVKRMLFADVEFADGQHRVFAIRVERRRPSEEAGRTISAGSVTPISRARFKAYGERIAEQLLANAEAEAEGKIKKTSNGMIVRYGKSRVTAPKLK